MILEQGEKVLIVHRRLFEEDHPRFFTGIIDAFEQGLAKVTGYSWIRNQFDVPTYQKGEKRTKICALSSGTLMVYELPSTVVMESMNIETENDGRVMLCDGNHFKLDISESHHNHKAKGRAK